MIEFDLVPRDYRLRLIQEGRLRRASTALLVAMSLFVAASGGFAYANATLGKTIEALQAMKAVTGQQTAKLATARSQKAALDHQWKLLQSLRGGTHAEHMFVAIDRALLTGDVWFNTWSFRRQGSRVEKDESGVETGYFIVLPSASEDHEPLKVETHMTIKGAAINHSALSTFVRNLFKEPEIADVRVLRTSLHGRARKPAVEFELAIIVDSRYG